MNINSSLLIDIYQWLRTPAHKLSMRAYGVERLEPRTVLSASGFADGPHHHSAFAGREPLAHYPAADFGQPSMAGRPHDSHGERFPPPLFGHPAWEPNRHFPPPIETNKSSPVVLAPAPDFEPLNLPALNVSAATPAERSSPIFSARIELKIDFGSAVHTTLPSIRPSASGGGDLNRVDIVFAELGEAQILIADPSSRSSDLTNGKSLLIPVMDDDWGMDFWKELPLTDDDAIPQPSIVRQADNARQSDVEAEELIELEAADDRRLKRRPLAAGEIQEDNDDSASFPHQKTRLMSALAAARFAERPLLEWLPIAEGHELGDAQAVAPNDDGLLELPVLTANAAITAILRPEALPALEMAATPEGTLEGSLELYQAFETADATAVELPFDFADLPIDQPQPAEPTGTSITLVE